MTRFEDRLELELEAVVADNAAPVAQRRRRFGWKPRIALVGALAAAATAIAISGTVHTAPAAWAVEKTGEGTVKIKFNELEDPEGLERALAELGLRADITFVPLGKTCAEGSHTWEADPDQPVHMVENLGPTDTIELRYGPQRPDQSVVLDLMDTSDINEARLVLQLGFGNAIGPITPCEIVDGGSPTEVRPK